MFENIETNRLLLKCIDQSDGEFIFEEFQYDFINQYLFDQEPMSDITQADDLIEFYNTQEPRDQNRWVLINKLENKKMGTCGFHLWVREKNQVEIGFELMQQYTGKGYMSEAIQALIEFARVKMQVIKIIAIVYIDNSNCKKLLSNFGFKMVDQEECIFRGTIYLYDIYELALLQD